MVVQSLFRYMFFNNSWRESLLELYSCFSYIIRSLPVIFFCVGTLILYIHGLDSFYCYTRTELLSAYDSVGRIDGESSLPWCQTIDKLIDRWPNTGTHKWVREPGRKLYSYHSIMTLQLHGPLTRYVKLRVAHAPGMPGTFSPPQTSKETVGSRSRHASRQVRHARAVMHVRIANPRWWGKRSRHSRCMRNPQVYVSGKRYMV